MEDLKIVKVFIFVESHINATLHINDRQVNQNTYVYEEVTKVIASDRIKMVGRYAKNGYQRKGYPKVPITYRFLKIHDPIPYYYPILVSECSRFLYSPN